MLCMSISIFLDVDMHLIQLTKIRIPYYASMYATILYNWNTLYLISKFGKHLLSSALGCVAHTVSDVENLSTHVFATPFRNISAATFLIHFSLLMSAEAATGFINQFNSRALVGSSWKSRWCYVLFDLDVGFWT